MSTSRKKSKLDWIARGHNPRQLTNRQVGKGWRLLTKEEVKERQPSNEIQGWVSGRWATGLWCGECPDLPYRTRKPAGYWLTR